MSRTDERQSNTEAERATRSGVDRSLISWMLSLSPEERLAVAEDWVNMVDEFGDGKRDAD